MQITLGDLLGPFALTVGLLFATAVLWRDHLRADREDREQRDRALALVEGIIPTLKELSSAQHEANRNAADRHRRADG